MSSIHDGGRVLGRSDLSAEILDDDGVWHSEGLRHIDEIPDVGLGTIQSTLLLGDHHWHGISEGGLDECCDQGREGCLPVIWVLYRGRDVNSAHSCRLCLLALLWF